jgi:ubiquinol-cytochrome c reductase cytochrome b subunit
VPEWYFLPFYAILRAITFNIGPIDSKLGGVLAMLRRSRFCSSCLGSIRQRCVRRLSTLVQVLFFWIFVANCIFLGWLGSKPAEGWYIPAMQISTFYYFAFFVIIMPLLGLFETPKKQPNSITEAVLEKNKGGSGHPVGAAAEPQTKG